LVFQFTELVGETELETPAHRPQ